MQNFELDQKIVNTLIARFMRQYDDREMSLLCQVELRATVLHERISYLLGH